MIFPCPRFTQTHIQNERRLLRFGGKLQVYEPLGPIKNDFFLCIKIASQVKYTNLASLTIMETYGDFMEFSLVLKFFRKSVDLSRFYSPSD